MNDSWANWFKQRSPECCDVGISRIGVLLALA